MSLENQNWFDELSRISITLEEELLAEEEAAIADSQRQRLEQEEAERIRIE